MDNTQKILIALIVILGAVLLVTNIGKLTGNVLQSEGVETYVPEEVPTTTTISATCNGDSNCIGGNVLDIEVTIGNDGCEGEVEIIPPGTNAPRKTVVKLRGCGDTCNPSITDKKRVETASHTMGVGWEKGQYYVSVFDKGSKEEAKAYFTIE